MAIASCPKCSTKLKVPDGAPATVRCPKCQTVFKTNPPAQPAFEVVDEAPPKPAPRPSAAAKPASPADDFEVVDEAPAKKKVVAKTDLDDDDDRPRKKRRDDDDDDDRPRSKKRSRDDDDDDARPRKSKRSSYYDDDEFDFKPNPGKRDGFASGKLGAMLLSLSFWTDVGMYGLLTLFVVIMWSGGDITSVLGLLIGPMRVVSWLVGLAGIGLCIAGPARARKLAVASAILAAIHLLLIFLGFLLVAKLGDFDFRDRPPSETTTSKSNGPTVSMEELGLFGLGLGLGTSIVPAEFTMPTIVYGSKLLGKSGLGDIIMFLLASACDIARLILVMLTLKTMAEAAKAHDGADKCRIGAKAVAIVCGSAIVLTLFIAIIVVEGEMRKAARHLAGFTFLAIMLSHCLMMILPALGAMQAAGGLGRRKN